jgi:hypothetical protein
MSVLLPDFDRTRHVYIAGKSQSGKSTLINWMALQDIAQGKGVCVIDPHGDLVKRLIHYIPKRRVDDTIYLDATAPVPIDFMGWEQGPDGSFNERDTLGDDLLVTFMRFSVNWGDRMDAVLRYAIAALLDAKHSTFLDIYYFLSDQAARARILKTVKNQEIVRWWENDRQFLPKDAHLPITSRMAKFLLTPALRAILGSPKPTLNMFDIMENRKILLVNLARVGQETGNLLGTLLVSKIQQAAMRRQKQKPKDRVPFYLYVDEFQHFQTSAFDVILSEAGKYKLCLTLAHQYVDQLDPKIRNSVLGNVSSFILFRLNEKDALCFRGELGNDSAGEPLYRWLLTLDTGRAIYRPAKGPPRFIHTPPPPGPSKASYAEIIRKRTVEKYSCNTVIDMVQSKEDDEIKPTARPKNLPPHRD